MSAHDWGYGADDADDIELGAAVFSKTHTRGADVPRGGIVVGIQLDGDDRVLAVTTVEWPRGTKAGPETFDIDRSDIDLAACRFLSDEARGCAAQVAEWVSSGRGPSDPMVKAWWYGIAADLARAGAVTLWLPGEEARYQRARAAKAAS